MNAETRAWLGYAAENLPQKPQFSEVRDCRKRRPGTFWAWFRYRPEHLNRIASHNALPTTSITEKRSVRQIRSIWVERSLKTEYACPPGCDHSISTSAGMMIAGSPPLGRGGSSTFVAFHPGWRSVPNIGALPVTLPVRRMAAAS